MLNPMTLLTAVLLLIFSPAPAPRPMAQDAASAAAADKNPVKPTAASQADAKRLFNQDCSMCHGENGNGQTDLAKEMGLKLDDWTDARTLAGKSDQELFKLIRNGKDKMPPEAVGRAKDDQVWNLIIYIRKFSSPDQGTAPK